MPILNYTTKIDAIKTVGEIVEILVKHGAKRIAQDYEGERVSAVCFMIDTPFGVQAIRLPANAENVLKVLNKQKVKADFAQAERVAWRIVKDWVEAQMAILESEQVSMSEIFLPYMINDDGQTVYQLFEQKQLLLGGGQA